MPLVRKARFFWVYPIAIWLFATANTSELSLRLGTVCALLGEALRLWANGYVGHRKVNVTQKWRNDPKIGHLITGGPYAHVRHPLYVGTFLIGLGFCVAMRSFVVAIGALLFFAIVYRAKVAREEETILGEWGDEYEAYRRAVPRWFPTMRPYRDRDGRWSWAGIRASQELKTLIWVLVCLIAVYLREEFFQEHERFFTRAWAKHLGVLLLLAGLIASDLGMELVKRLKRQSSPNVAK